MSTKAYTIALEAHRTQKYGQHTYVYHLRNVVDKCTLLYTDSLRSDEMYLVENIAWLHDLFEDTNYSEESLRVHFESYAYVDELVDALKAITKLDYENREEYLERCARNKWALMVKIADTLSNLECSFASREQRRINKYLNQLDKLRSYL